MKWIKIFGFMTIFLMLASLCLSELIEVPREELEEYLARMEKDRETIKNLMEEKVSLHLRIQECQLQISSLQQSSDEQEGIYLGGHASYPLGANALIMYKFHRWGLYATGGYSNGFNVGLGAIFKMR